MSTRASRELIFPVRSSDFTIATHRLHPSSDQKSVTANFSPVLSVYVFKADDLVKPYKEGKRLSSPLPASAKCWSKDLRTLHSATADLTLGVAYNNTTQKYDVTQDDSGL